MRQNVLLIDNLDSFSFNLVDAFERLGCAVAVRRNSISADAVFAEAERKNALIVLSPGPGRPEEAGCCLELIARARGKLPVFGVCLGHQAIALEAGAKVMRAGETVHGRSSLVEHDGRGPFASIPSPMKVGRYHSLRAAGLPERYTVHAIHDDVVMAMSDSDALQTSVQFHPESILTPLGDRLLANVVRGAAR